MAETPFVCGFQKPGAEFSIDFDPGANDLFGQLFLKQHD